MSRRAAVGQRSTTWLSICRSSARRIPRKKMRLRKSLSRRWPRTTRRTTSYRGTSLSAPERLLEAWAVLGAATTDERSIRVEPTGLVLSSGDVLAGLDIFGGRHLLVPAPAHDVREDRRSAGVQIRAAALE